MAPMAAKNAVVEMEKTSALQGIVGAFAGNGVAGGCPPSPDPSWSAKSRASKWLRDLIRGHQEDNSLNLAYRDGVFEPDLAALRSCSYAARVAWQRRRDVARRDQAKGWQSKLSSLMGWEE